MQTEAWVHRDKDSPPQLERITLGAPAPNEVVVRIAAVGVCHTDLFAPVVFGLPAVFGHEGAGVVQRVGNAVTKVVPGDRVVLTFGSCGQCPACMGSSPAYCTDSHHLQFGGTREDGTVTMGSDQGAVAGSFFQQSSFARHALATERNVVKIPDDFPFDLAAPLGCGIQTGAGTVLNALQPRRGESLVVFGAGAVGLVAVMAARIAGCNPLIAVDVLPERLALAAELGATEVLNAASDDVVARIVELTGGGARYTIECAGAVQSFESAIAATHRRGICALLTVPKLGQPFPFAPMPILQGRTLTGVIEGNSIPDQFIPRLIELQRSGQLPYERLLSRYSFADLPMALADAAAHRAIKPVVLID